MVVLYCKRMKRPQVVKLQGISQPKFPQLHKTAGYAVYGIHRRWQTNNLLGNTRFVTKNSVLIFQPYMLGIRAYAVFSIYIQLSFYSLSLSLSLSHSHSLSIVLYKHIQLFQLSYWCDLTPILNSSIIFCHLIS